MRLESALMIIVGQIISFGITINSFQVLKAAFKKKDWSLLILGTIFIGCGLLLVIYSSIMPLVWDSNTLDLTYVWTFLLSIPISYFLFTYISKTKKYKDKMDAIINEKEDTASIRKKRSPFFKSLEAITSDIFMLIFYLAILLGFIFLMVKLVKYFWYL